MDPLAADVIVDADSGVVSDSGVVQIFWQDGSVESRDVAETWQAGRIADIVGGRLTVFDESGSALEADRTFKESGVQPGQSVPELKGSIGEGPNHSNFSDQSSVKILAKFGNFRLKIVKIQEISTLIFSKISAKFRSNFIKF